MPRANKTTADMTVRESVLNLLRSFGIDTIFGIPGDGVNGIIEALRKNQIHVIDFKEIEKQRERMKACMAKTNMQHPNPIPLEKTPISPLFMSELQLEMSLCATQGRE